jgi:hypothetical protein
VNEVTNVVLDNASTVAKPNVPKLSLHELNALRPHEEAVRARADDWLVYV